MLMIIILPSIIQVITLALIKAFSVHHESFFFFFLFFSSTVRGEKRRKINKESRREARPG